MKKRIKSIFVAKGGTGFPVDEQGKKGTIPFFKVSDTNNEGNEIYLNNSNNYVDENTFKNGIIKEPSIVVPKVGEVLKLNKRRISNPPFLIDNNLMALSLKNKFHNIKFFYYVMLVIDFNKYVNKGSVPSITFGLFSNETIFIPKNINKTVMFLDKKTSLIDKKISLLEKKIELYEEYKKSFLEKIFGDLNSYHKKTLKSIVLKTLGGDWGDDADESTVGAVIVVRVNNFNDGSIDYSNITYRMIKPSSVVSRRLKKGELIIEKSGGGEKTPVGRVCLFNEELENVLFSNFIAKISIKDSMNPEFVKYFFKYLYDSRKILKYIKQNTGIQNLELPALLQEKIPMVDKIQQTIISNKIDNKFCKINRLISLTKKEIELQKEYKKTLINDVVTGKIEV